MNFMQRWKTQRESVESYAQYSQKSVGGGEQPIFENIEKVFCQSETRIEVPTPDPATFTLEEMPDTLPLPMPFDFSELKPEHCVIQQESCIHCLSWAQRNGLPWWYGTCLRYGHEVTSKSRCVRGPI